MKTVYDKIHEITRENLQAAGQDFSFSKNAFFYLTQCPTDQADLLSLEQYDKDDFVQAAYLALLQRPVDERAYAAYQEKMKRMTDAEFRALVVQTLITSREFHLVNVEVHNNIYTQEAASSAAAPAAAAATPVPARLMRIYRKLPTGMKRLAKKMAGIQE